MKKCIPLKAIVTLITWLTLLQIMRTRCDVIINEVRIANNHDIATQEFIELYNTDMLPVGLDEYTVVIYSGETNRAYAIISLEHGMIFPHRYFIIGSSNVNPQPDRLIDETRNVNILRNGTNGIALYHGNSAQFVNNMSVTNDSLIDAIVYDNNGGNEVTLTRVLAPGQTTIQAQGQRSSQQMDSISRCNGIDLIRFDQWNLHPATPGSRNNCTQFSPEYPFPPGIPSTGDIPNGELNPDMPPFVDTNLIQFILINEFDIGAQYVELYDGGIGQVSLDGLMMVFYSGATSTVYANPIHFNGYKTNDEGYFLIAPSNFHPTPDIPLTTPLANNGVNAIAIYFGLANDLTYGSPVTSQQLADAVVYGDIPNPEDNYLVSVLSRGNIPLVEELSNFDEVSSHGVKSLSRCSGWCRYMPQSFTTTDSSPKSDNICELPDIVINEINVDAEQNALNEFIELYDGGIGRQSLDGLVVVLYNGKSSMVYRSYDLTGYTTNDRGFAVIGFVNNSNVNIPVAMDTDRGFLQPGLDAVALHLGAPQRFAQGTPISRHNLVDAIIYGTNDDPDLAFLHALLPFQDIPNELTRLQDVDHSISRCYCCQRLNSSSFGVGLISPGSININCVRNNDTVTETLSHYQNIVRINEVLTGESTGYFEIYDSGLGGIPLDGFVLVVYDGNGNGRSSLILPLDGYLTDIDGFFVVGTSDVIPTPQLIINTATTGLPRISGAVALYQIPTEDFQTFSTGTPATRSGLLDVLVYGGTVNLDSQLSQTLIPNQSQVKFYSITDGNSINRCFSHDASDQLAYAIGQSSPGVVNHCPLPPIVINEVNVVGMGQDIGEFVELSSKGVPHFPLNDLHLIFWRGHTATAYKIIRINGKRTDANGFFLIGYQHLVSPRPDMTPFNRPKNYIKDASNAISLHFGQPEQFIRNMAVTDTGLIDGMAHRNPTPGSRGYDSYILGILTPGVEPGMEPSVVSPSNRDESINRCVAPSSGMVSWQAAHISPKAQNHCPTRLNAELIINEVNLVSSTQYIELWDKGAGFTNLDDFVVVLYGEDNRSYWTIPLRDYMTDAMGYFILGVASTVPHAQFIFAEGFLRPHYGAIALHRSVPDIQSQDNGPARVDGLLDAIVYSQEDETHNVLSNILTPNSFPIKSTLLQMSSTSLSRCLSGDLRNTTVFTVTPATPKTMNDCPVFADDIFINEVNVEQPGDRSKEFIELYDGGRGNVPLKYLSLVLFNGHYDDKSYSTFDLDGYSTNDKGFFLIASDRVRSGDADIAINTGQAGLLQNGPDAIALYRAPSGAFPYGTIATTNSLIDAIVYHTGVGLSHSLVDKLLPGRSMVLEDPEHLSADESISRCHGNHRLDPLMYSLCRPTPGRRNDCTKVLSLPDHMPSIFINEISVSTLGQDYIELVGSSDLLLSGLILVFYNGDNQDRSYYEIDLNGAKTDTNGFLLIGNRNINPVPDIIITENIQTGPDAVVLYYARILDFPRGTILSADNIVDSLVYGTNGSNSPSMLTRLAPGQVMAEMTSDMTLSRCVQGQASTMSAFSVSTPTPGSPNDCSLSPIIINEIDLGYQAYLTGPQGQYIELYDGGRGGVPLTDYILVLFSEAEGKAYLVVPLNQYLTNSNGYLIIGNPTSAAVMQVHIAMPLGFIKEGAGAVVLYKSRNTDDFYTRMLPTQLNLVDVVVYGMTGSSAVTLMEDLLPTGQKEVNIDDGISFSHPWSLSRCTCCQAKQSSVFGIGVPTPLRTNDCSTMITQTRVLPITINEINLRNQGSNTEYIELKGPVDAPLDNFILVIFTERGRASYTVNLSEKRFDQLGLVLIGSRGMTPTPTVSFASSTIPIIHQGFGAVVLYRGTLTDFPVGTQMSGDNVVDAVVWINDHTKLDNELTNVLTPGSDSFYAGNLGDDDSSISRCSCCSAQLNSAYTLSTPTPLQTNVCPREAYSIMIQMRLINAAYDIWMENPGLVEQLRAVMVKGVNQYCQCGFNVNYVKDEKILNGSVIYQATLLALDATQSDLIMSSYKQYIQVTSKVKVHGTIYLIDSQCTINCSDGGLPRKHSGKHTGLSAAAEEAIAILAIIALAVIAVCLYIVLRYRHQIWTYIKGPHNLSVNAEFPVIFRRSQNQDQSSLTDNKPEDSFDNPIYMYEGASASPSLPRIVVKDSLSSQEPSNNFSTQVSKTEPSQQSPQKNGSTQRPKEEPISDEINQEPHKAKQFISSLMSKSTGAIPKRKSNMKGSFENPLYQESNLAQGQNTTPVSVNHAVDDKVNSQMESAIKKKPIENGNQSESLDGNEKEGRMMKMSFKKTAKPKRPDGFSNPLYGDVVNENVNGQVKDDAKIDVVNGGNQNQGLDGDEKEGRMMKMTFKKTVKPERSDGLDSTEKEGRKMKMSFKKTTKSTKPDGFSNPLYGANTGPAEIDVAALEHTAGAFSVSDCATKSETTKELERVQSDKTDSNGAVAGNQHDQEMGIKERLWKKLKKEHVEDGGVRSDYTTEQKPSQFMHM